MEGQTKDEAGSLAHFFVGMGGAIGVGFASSCLLKGVHSEFTPNAFI